MRFLCLHGIGSNAQILETQLSALRTRLGPQYEFVFLQGDLSANPGPGVQGMAGGPYYSFFALPTKSQLLAAFDLIDQALEAEGPFDGIIGFSQGASLAVSYLLTHSKPHCPFACGLFFCSSMPFDIESAPFRAFDDDTFRDEATGEDVTNEIRSTVPEILDRKSYPGLEQESLIRRYVADRCSTVDLPSVHIYASNDSYFSQSQGVGQLFSPFEKQEVVHSGGHSIPWEEKTTVQIVECVRRMVHAADLQ